MMEEYKDEYPEEFERDAATKEAFKMGFQSYRSDSIDYVLEHHEEWPGTMVLFYDSNEYEEPIMRLMVVRLMDVFTDLNKKHVEKV